MFLMMEVTRYLLMLEDWHWGIIFWQEIAYFINGNKVIFYKCP
jgi:hypothetical protein